MILRRFSHVFFVSWEANDSAWWKACFSGALQRSLIHNEDVQVIEVENILLSGTIFLGVEALKHPHDGTTVDAVELSPAYDFRQKGSG